MKRVNIYLARVTALCSHFVDLGLGNVSTLFSLLQLMLDLPALGQVRICLLLLESNTQTSVQILKKAYSTVQE